MPRYITELDDGTQVLTHSELVEYIQDSETTVMEAERVEVSEDFIDAKIDDALRTAFSEILSQHGLHSGDIRPLMDKRIEDSKDDLKDGVKTWIEARLR